MGWTCVVHWRWPPWAVGSGPQYGHTHSGHASPGGTSVSRQRPALGSPQSHSHMLDRASGAISSSLGPQEGLKAHAA